MRWRKLGRLYRPAGLHPKLLTHAANPVPLPLGGALYRIFYSGRDAEQRSSVGFVDVDIERRRVEYVHPGPACRHGDADSFCSHGISIGNWYDAGGARWLGFMGWRIPAGEHWRGEIGRLRLSEDRTLVLDERPLMARDAIDPLSLSYPWIMGGAASGYHMWYGSTLAWDAGNGEMLHVIRHARSQDGVAWVKDDAGVPYEIGVAQAFSRPTVMVDPASGYHMWFSYRPGSGTTYRIGYARSEDAEHWTLRLAEAGIEPSPDGWDARMIEYPYVFEHEGASYLLYNGDGYGASGFGLAVGEPA